jgi:hypothetical protein
MLIFEIRRRYVVGEGWSDWHDATAPSRAMRGTNAPAVFSSATAIPYTCLTAAGVEHAERYCHSQPKKQTIAAAAPRS